MYTVHSTQYTVHSWLGLLISAFLLSTTYCLLPTTIHAQEVDILWRGETYVPPFYKGLPLWGRQSKISLLAIPQDIEPFQPSETMFWWTQNSTVLGNYNAIGKNYISFTDTVLSRTQSIKLELLTADFLPLVEKRITISPTYQKILIYEDHPLYGLMLHNEIGDEYVVKGQEISLVAIPLFFATDSRHARDINYEWRAGGRSQTTSGVTYRVPEGVRGTSQIRVSINKEGVVMQDIGKSFLIQFE